MNNFPDDLNLDEMFSEGTQLEPLGGAGAEFNREFITGVAGSGKTFSVRKKIEANPKFGKLCATTGIAAINLGAGVTTINSLLAYYNTDSLKENFYNGKLAKRLMRVSEEGYENIVLDEVSMMDGRQLDLLEKGLIEHNNRQDIDQPLGLILTGDMCQLPPIKAPWAFEAECWPKYAEHITKLTKIWRQDDPTFLKALNCFRSGDGNGGMVGMMESGCSLKGSLDYDFDGTTIIPKNVDVDNFNKMRLAKLPGKSFNLKSFRWADDRYTGILKQWDGIPESAEYKDGALVMILSNSTPDFRYVNGDLATIEQFDTQYKELVLKLKRNGDIIRLKPLLRQHTEKETPLEFRPKKENGQDVFPTWPTSRDQAMKLNGNRVHYDEDSSKWVVGEIYYYPIRLGWASTCHKCQGLTMDNIQIDIRDSFFAAPAMMYTAFSRARTPKSISIVGNPNLMKRCTIDPKIKEWL